MAKRSIGDLSEAQRLVLQQWADHMGVGEPDMVNMLNSLHANNMRSVWKDLDRVAKIFKACDCNDC
jgi:hypothetical protein